MKRTHSANINIYGAKISIPKELLFGFFVRQLLFTPLTIFLQLDFSSDEFLIFAGPIVDTLAFGAGQF